MAEPLKNQYGPAIPRAIANMVHAVHPAFPKKQFLRDALDGYEALELMPRGHHIAHVLRRHLPENFEEAVGILLDSVDAPHGEDIGGSMAAFLFLPHTALVAHYGLAHFEASMHAQHALTQRFTAEFSIRPFLMQHQAATLARLRQWTQDPSEHVRRLVSEGTRPRLPWAPRLPAFQKDPAPVLALLELLKDDPALYVRRSVANNLNDIGKDHPEVLTRTTHQWLQGASEERQWIVRHALRTAIKRGEPGALAVLGFGAQADVAVRSAQITPSRAAIGEKVVLAFEVVNRSAAPQRVLVDFRIHYTKANGSTAAKVFKLKTLELQAGETARLQKSVSLAQMSTRTHYPGRHQVDALLNGHAQPLGHFDLA